MKRFLISLGATLALTGILATGGQVATTQDSAEALTKYSCTNPYKQYGFWFRMCYYDYNWYEESWWGGSHRDGWVRESVNPPLYWG